MDFVTLNAGGHEYKFYHCNIIMAFKRLIAHRIITIIFDGTINCIQGIADLSKCRDKTHRFSSLPPTASNYSRNSIIILSYKIRINTIIKIRIIVKTIQGVCDYDKF